MSGIPPASEITSSRSVRAIRSRIADDFITLRPLGEQRRVAFNVPRGRARTPFPAGSSPIATNGSVHRRLVYRHGSSRYSTVHLVFDIFQGIGVATAVGIRPFLPCLVVGALAAGDIEIQFDHTSYSFLQSPAFLLALVIGAVVLAVLEGRLAPDRLERGPIALALAAISLALGALLFAGSLCRGGDVVWPGLGRWSALRARRNRGDTPTARTGASPSRRVRGSCRPAADRRGCGGADRGTVRRGAACGPDRIRLACCGWCSTAAGATSRSTPAFGSSVEPTETASPPGDRPRSMSPP